MAVCFFSALFIERVVSARPCHRHGPDFSFKVCMFFVFLGGVWGVCGFQVIITLGKIDLCIFNGLTNINALLVVY